MNHAFPDSDEWEGVGGREVYYVLQNRNHAPPLIYWQSEILSDLVILAKTGKNERFPIDITGFSRTLKTNACNFLW